MRMYEVIFIVKPMEEEATNAVIEKFTKLIQANGGTIEKEDRWGKKRLAYEINDHSEGYYVLLYVNAEARLRRRVRPRDEDHRRSLEAHDRPCGRRRGIID